jgi:hypothetical protein
MGRGMEQSGEADHRWACTVDVLDGSTPSARTMIPDTQYKTRGWRRYRPVNSDEGLRRFACLRDI